MCLSDGVSSTDVAALPFRHRTKRDCAMARAEVPSYVRKTPGRRVCVRMTSSASPWLDCESHPRIDREYLVVNLVPFLIDGIS